MSDGVHAVDTYDLQILKNGINSQQKANVNLLIVKISLPKTSAFQKLHNLYSVV